MSHITNVQTSTGFAVVILNRGHVLVSFYYSVDAASVGTVQFRVQNERVVYDNGWNLKVLNWLIETYQPQVTLKLEG